MKYEDYFKKYLNLIEKTLTQVLPASNQNPSVIHEAMRYAVFPGGKRFRPVLTLAACEAAGGKAFQALLPAASLELIHCYSLVHDDLPSLDNDEMRRGKLTCHKRYGEANAILTGDGLLTLAFNILGKMKPAEKALRVLDEISTAAGTYGMIGGQVADLMAGKDLSLPELDYISVHKTGKLIKASVVCGAIAAGAPRPVISRMKKYGEAVGLAFQLVDDILDQDGSLKIMTADEVCDRARDLISVAKRAIKPFGKKAEKLHKIADYLLQRIPGGTHTHAALDR